MKQELRDKLIKKFPDIFPDEKVGPSGYPGKKTRLLPFQFGCGDGWFQLLYDLCTDFKKEMEPEDHLIAQQVKEKFGGLRFYANYDHDKYKKIQDIINAAESKSHKICEQCGKPGRNREDLSWMRTLCDVCRTELDIKDIIE